MKDEEIGHWRKIIIERLTRTQDDYGGIVETWTTHLTVYANVIPVSGREIFSSDRPNISRMTRFFIYYLSDLTEKDRISYEGDYYDIVYKREVGNKETIEILGEVVK